MDIAISLPGQRKNRRPVNHPTVHATLLLAASVWISGCQHLPQQTQAKLDHIKTSSSEAVSNTVTASKDAARRGVASIRRGASRAASGWEERGLNASSLSYHGRERLPGWYRNSRLPQHSSGHEFRGFNIGPRHW